VLFAEIKDNGWANKASFCFKADNQIHRQYDEMLSDCPLSHLWGLSLLSTFPCVYCRTIATWTIKPDFMPCPDPDLDLPPDFLEGKWDIDILSPEGFNKMKEIITDVVAAAAVL